MLHAAGNMTGIRTCNISRKDDGIRTTGLESAQGVCTQDDNLGLCLGGRLIQTALSGKQEPSCGHNGCTAIRKG
uniref:AlNc14C46G3734 protein n=1 Tax=Albugo laibachii Nc14 TaxID=890382 RepID=F0WAL0_9STRA|nr:AlNc14C46G3734 [Albugo laibachii Nc14]|eukprot:CCA18181.1 AlNc14C46G3734 [Albugo laibachii Nc14]